jgi:hypothetical protein
MPGANGGAVVISIRRGWVGNEDVVRWELGVCDGCVDVWVWNFNLMGARQGTSGRDKGWPESCQARQVLIGGSSRSEPKTVGGVQRQLPEPTELQWGKLPFSTIFSGISGFQGIYFHNLEGIHVQLPLSSGLF